MKICGCSRCPNPYEEFEIFLEQREAWEEKEFEDIFKASYNVGEMNELYEELESQFNSDMVKRINEYSKDSQYYWYSYGGSMGLWKRMQEE